MQVFSYKPKPGIKAEIYRCIGDIPISMKSMDYLQMPECVIITVQVSLSESEYNDYAKDTSKKIRAVLTSKDKSGKPLCTNPPYGYLKDPNDKFRWIANPVASEFVKEIFRLCVAGYGPSQIAAELTRRRIAVTSAHLANMGLNSPCKVPDDLCAWQQDVIADILTRREYLGHTVNFKTLQKSYKSKKLIENDPSEWVVFENTHEPIINQKTFDIVQNTRSGRRRCTPMDEMPILSGMLFYANCGANLYQN